MIKFAIIFLTVLSITIISCVLCFWYFRKSLKRSDDNNKFSYIELKQHLYLSDKEILRLNERISKIEKGSKDVEKLS